MHSRMVEGHHHGGVGNADVRQGPVPAVESHDADVGRLVLSDYGAIVRCVYAVAGRDDTTEW